MLSLNKQTQREGARIEHRKKPRKQVLLLLPCSQKGRGGLHGEASSGPAAVQPRAVHDARAGQQLTLKMILILRVCRSLTTDTFGFMYLFKLKIECMNFGIIFSL